MRLCRGRLRRAFVFFRLWMLFIAGFTRIAADPWEQGCQEAVLWKIIMALEGHYGAATGWRHEAVPDGGAATV